MATRQPACDPCRRFKVACDHKRPVCSRCIQSDRATICSYRAAPFKRQRHGRALSAVLGEQQQHLAISPPAPPPPPGSTSSPQSDRWPSIGHLGQWSHSSILHEVQSSGGFSADMVTSPEAHTSPAQDSSPGSCSMEVSYEAEEVARALRQLLAHCSLIPLKDLVTFWLAKGVNLALAEPLVRSCVATMDYIQGSWILSQRPRPVPALVMHLLQNSRCPFTFDAQSKMSDFLDHFSVANARLETLGIFVLAVIRATMDIPFFPTLYLADDSKYVLRRAATRLADCIVSLCLSLDCPSDLQYILQYEHFIVHSTVSGDQSLRCWRCLGEVISSALALGYHENIAAKKNLPPFLVELRTTAFSRIYFNDKSFAVYLGRPPRLSKRFAYFQIPSGRRDWDVPVASAANTPPNEIHEWDPETQFSYRAESRWSALCASLKDEILEIRFSNTGRYPDIKTSDIALRAEALWLALPPPFRLTGNLNRVDRSPFERDFMLGARLNYLQIFFLLHLFHHNSLASPSRELVDVAEQILTLVVEAVLCRDFLANAGSSMIWKISQYGLPAAGVLLLTAMRNHRVGGDARAIKDRSWQELSILAAEIQLGSVVPPGEPNRALLLTAAQTIQCVHDWRTSKEAVASTDTAPEQTDWQGLDDIVSTLSPDPWNLEMGFWQDLAEFRFLGPQTLPPSCSESQ